MKRMLLTLAALVWCLAQRTAPKSKAKRRKKERFTRLLSCMSPVSIGAMPKRWQRYWTPEAVYTNRLSGEQVVGREAIEKQFAGIFEDSKMVKLEASTTSIDFISPGVAIEQGTAKLLLPDPEPEESEYSAIYVKRDGQWLLDRVTEQGVIKTPSHYEQLKDLEWMVGKWVDQDDQATVTTECGWAKNNNFLVRSFTVQVLDRVDLSGMQIVSRDPTAKQIRSWVFDSDGGFGQGTWTRNGNRWSIQQSGLLSDGRKSSSVNILTYLDDDSFTLQSINRIVNGQLLPNIDEVEITKEKE